jgi:hypothetical protein
MGYHDTGPGALSDSAAAASTFGSICNFNEHEEETKGLNTRMGIDSLSSAVKLVPAHHLDGILIVQSNLCLDVPSFLAIKNKHTPSTTPSHAGVIVSKS